jgi:hypothetical protein
VVQFANVFLRHLCRAALVVGHVDEDWRSLVAIGLFALAVALPLLHLPTAWIVIAVYVLVGSLATIGRLVPVRSF